jgi:nucleoside-triphosphatase THEP1
MPSIYIVTGVRDGGKTLFLKELSGLLIADGIGVSGFLSEGEFLEGGHKNFKLASLSTPLIMPLASRSAEPDWFFAVGYWFNPEAVEAGNRIIREAIKERFPVIIMDEIGPVELEQKVWHEALTMVLTNYKGILVFSVREKLINEIITRYQVQEVTLVDIQVTSPAEIRGMLRSQFPAS